MYLCYLNIVLSSTLQEKKKKANLKLMIPKIEGGSLTYSYKNKEIKDLISGTILDAANITEEAKENEKELRFFIDEKTYEIIRYDEDLKAKINDYDDISNFSFSNLESFLYYFHESCGVDRRFYLQIIYLTVRFMVFVERNHNLNKDYKQIRERLRFIMCSLIEHTYLEENIEHPLYNYANKFFLAILKNERTHAKKLDGLEEIEELFFKNIEFSYLKCLKTVLVDNSYLNIIYNIILTLLEEDTY